MDGLILSKAVVALSIFGLGLVEALGGVYFDGKRTKDDFTIELISLITLPVLIQPGIFLLVVGLMEALFPGLENSWAGVSIGLQILAFLVFDDLMQYWWHRLSHLNRVMWKLHRPHHVIEGMGILVTYRNAVLYYVLMPGIWFSAILIFLGMGQVYMFYLPVKLIVILLAHSETKWDRFLYRYRWLHPLAWVIERVISTPSTHFAHHGLTAEDGISHPNGNFGNLLFLWDVLFGTAKITRRYPEKFGAWNQLKEPWYIQFFFPLLRSKDPRSEFNSLVTQQDYDPTQDYKKFDR
ncbi:MAG: sterol desaturase family protein [Bacteroidia bacterium]|nr:sterol desaturase family protein [Bacteroidia bacterium]